MNSVWGLFLQIKCIPFSGLQNKDCKILLKVSLKVTWKIYTVIKAFFQISTYITNAK